MSSFASLVRALMTIAAALFPTATMLGVFAQHPDDTVKVIEIVGNAVSALWLYLKQPHPWLAGPVADIKYWLASFFRRKPSAQ